MHAEKKQKYESFVHLLCRIGIVFNIRKDLEYTFILVKLTFSYYKSRHGVYP